MGRLGINIKDKALHYTKMYKTNNPFELADFLNIQVYHCPLGKMSGFYKYLKHHRCIYINSDIEDMNYKNLVMAHELGHAVLDTKENCYFMNNKTLLLTSKIERRANLFAAEFLISDELVNEYREYTIEQMSLLTGLDKDLIKLKLL